MRIVAIADTHGMHEQVDIPRCDVLIIAGDFCPLDDHEPTQQAQWATKVFLPWCQATPAKRVLLVAGNHDLFCENKPLRQEAFRNFAAEQGSENFDKVVYLQDGGIEIEGKKFYGTPWQPVFGGWAFNATEDHLALAWQLIPDDVDVLITHGPAHGLRDKTLGYQGSPPEHAGSTSLRWELDERLAPELHVFGHIHPAYGCVQREHTLHANVSVCNEKYRPINRAMDFEL